MPYDPKAPDVRPAVKLKREEQPRTEYKEQLGNIRVRLMHGPTMLDLLNYIPEFATATWQDEPVEHMSLKERQAVLDDLFDGHVLPTALETINLTFEIDGMDYVDVTHLLRHRLFSFSAQCTADRDMRHDDVVVKPSIMGNSAFFNQYRQITEMAKQLYAEMVDSNIVSVLDARTILPRNIRTFYYVRGTLKDWMAYIQQRLDEQIQPQSDNVIALYLYLEIVRQYPPLWNKIEIGGPDRWYIKTAPTGRSSNIYPPKKENDTFDWNENWFLYQKRREDFPGDYVYQNIKKVVQAKIERIGKAYEKDFGKTN